MTDPVDRAPRLDFAAFAREHPGGLGSARAGEGLPFQALFEPWVDALVDDVPANDLITVAAQADRRTWLISQLCAVAAPSLQSRFELFRTARTTPLAQVLEAAADPGSTVVLDAFLTSLWTDGLDRLTTELPGLVPRLERVAANWLAAALEFDRRLERDLSLLSELTDGQEVGPVVGLVGELGDRHHHGRSVTLVRSASGAQVVYKPRSLTGEAALLETISWLGERARGEVADYLPSAGSVIDRGPYGWMAYVRPEPCASMSDAAAYYRRCGGLLALVFNLCGTDCHHENVVAGGAHPFLVDCETLATPLLGVDDPARTARHIAAVAVRDSVLTTGLLPTVQSLATGDTYDSGALGSGDVQKVDVVRTAWVNLNTDHQRREPGVVHTGPLANLPVVDGKIIGAEAMVDDVIDGFLAVSALFRDHRDELLAPGGPIDRLATLRTRIILRPTQLYADLRSLSLESSAMADPVGHFARLTELGQAEDGLWEGLRRRHGDVVAAEIDAIRELDIPRFEIEAESGLIATPDSLVGQSAGVGVTGLDRVRQRIAESTPAVDRIQVSLLRGTFHHRAAIRSLDSTAVMAGSGPGDDGLGGANPLATETALDWIEQIAQLLDDLAVRGDDGSACWIVPAVSHYGDRLLIRPMDASLYQGASGVALFLAAAARLTGEPWIESLCRAALLSADDPGVDRHPGGFSGLGSSAYAFSVVGQLLDDAELARQAEAIIAGVDDEQIASDDVADLVVGSAGMALVALRIARSAGSDAAMDLALRCCRHVTSLLRRRFAEESGPLLAGLAHGVSAQLVALTRLRHLTGSDEFDEAIDAALIAEHRAFDPDLHNWLDLRPEAPPGRAMLGWCSGAPGIALARLEPGLSGPRVDGDLEAALETTAAGVVGPRDQLCCGAFGRIAVLFEAGQRLRRPDLSDRAALAAGAVVERAGSPRNARFVLQQHGGADHLGFFQGLTGIGWQLARMVASDELPELLLLD